MVGANEVRFAWLNRDLDDGTPHGTHRGKSSPNRGSIVSRQEKGCDLYEVEHVKAWCLKSIRSNASDNEPLKVLAREQGQLLVITCDYSKVTHHYLPGDLHRALRQ